LSDDEKAEEELLRLRQVGSNPNGISTWQALLACLVAGLSIFQVLLSWAIPIIRFLVLFLGMGYSLYLLAIDRRPPSHYKDSAENSTKGD